MYIQSLIYEPHPAHVHGDEVQKEDQDLLGGRQLWYSCSGGAPNLKMRKLRRSFLSGYESSRTIRTDGLTQARYKQAPCNNPVGPVF